MTTTQLLGVLVHVGDLVKSLVIKDVFYGSRWRLPSFESVAASLDYEISLHE